MSYVYHALYAYFSRDNVALPGFAAFFKDGSEEERGHAELLMDFQVWLLDDLPKGYLRAQHLGSLPLPPSPRLYTPMQPPETCCCLCCCCC